MTSLPPALASIDLAEVRFLLCDADGNLFPSEGPAFVASAEVTNRLLAELGVDRSYTPTELRRAAEGRNFRSTAGTLATLYGVTLDAATLDRYVPEEKREVTAHLARVLEPDEDVIAPLTALAPRFRLAAVSSSGTSRLEACFRAAGLDDLFPPQVRFSAEDSLRVPTSKPDPAIYVHAGDVLGVSGARALAVEDAPAGVASAVAAGFPTVGNLMFVAPEEREERAVALREAGAGAIVDSWWELADRLGVARSTEPARPSTASHSR